MTDVPSTDGADDPGREDGKRAVEQEVASGRSWTTPFVALGSVVGVIAIVVAIVLALAMLAYFLA